MSQIVFTQTFERRDGIDSMGYGRIPTDHKVTIFQNPDKVAVVSSTLVCGVPRGHSDKRYYYWRSTASAGFRRNAAGTIVPFSCTRLWDAKANVPWKHRMPTGPFTLLADPLDETAKVFRHAVWDTFGITNVNQLYPMLDRYGLSKYESIPGSLTVPFRAEDWDIFTQKTFGKKRANKRLIAAVKETEPYFVSYAQQFRGLVDDSSIQKFIENNHFDEEMEETFRPHNPSIRPFLRAASPETRKNLIGVTFDNSDLMRVEKFVRFGKPSMIESARGQDHKNWSELVPGRMFPARYQS